jgi:hypothetical protein
MFQLGSERYLPHVVYGIVLLAAPVMGQQPATAILEPVVAGTSAASAASTSAPGIKKKLSKPFPDYSDAKGAKFESKELDKDSADSSDTAQNPPAAPQDTQALAKKLANPVASLISFPIQMNFDFRMGTGSGWRMTTNIQPVIPIALNKDWNLISRTILPIIHQGNVIAAGTGETGLGDVVQSIFFSPNKTEPVIWGIGPAALIPTATHSSLGSKQWGFGPTVVVLKQRGPWTVGALWNHIWSVSGGNGRPKVNADFMQPFLAFSTKDGWTYTVNTESTYDWTGHSWSVPIHAQFTKIVRFGKQPVSFGGGIRCWVTSPGGGPEGCGLRAIVTGIFPKK